MNKKRLLPLFLLSGAFILASCTSNNPDVPSSGNGTNSSQNSASSGGTLAPVEEYFKVTSRSDTRYTLSPNKTSAKAGETISVTVTVQDGYSVIAVYANSQKLEKSGDVYTFTMPEIDVVLRAELSVEGEITAQGGDVAVAFSKAEGSDTLWIAKGVKINNTSSFSVKVGNTTLSIANVDRFRCFAPIEASYSSSSGNLSLSGGSTYDFYYDSSLDRPLYFKRTSVDVLPSNASTLENMFHSSVQSEYALYPSNVKKVTYSNSSSAEKYVWQAYENNASLATVTNTKTNTEKAFVYKSFDQSKNLYTVVDSYLEAANDSTKLDDTDEFSGKYLAVDNPYNDNVVDYSRQEVGKEAALFDSTHYSHDMNSIDFDIMYAYRVNMTQGDEFVLAECNVTSTKTESGFQTKIDSRLTYDSSKNAQLTEELKYHDEFAVTLNFNADGSLLSGSYLNTRYDALGYDFTKEKITNEKNGKTVKELSFSYEYGNPETKPAEGIRDVSAYFLSSSTLTKDTVTLADSSVVSETDTNKNKLHQGDKIDNSNIDDYLTINAPKTVWDTWQYTLTASSNQNVLGYNASTNTWRAKTTGSTVVTISNKTDKEVSLDLNVDVVYMATIGSFYFDHNFDAGDYGADDHAQKAIAFVGSQATYRLVASGEKGTPWAKKDIPLPSDLKLKANGNDYGLTYSIDWATGDITFDGSKVTGVEKNQSVTIVYTPETSHAQEGGLSSDSTLTITLKNLAYTADDIKGTYTNTENSATLKLTGEDAGSLATNNSPYKGSVTVGTKTYDFSYGFNAYSLALPLHFPDSSVDGKMTFKEDGTIAVIMESVSYSGEDTGATSTSILGSFATDETAESEVIFTRA